MATVGPRNSGASENINMWFRVFLLVSVATVLTNANGTYRLIDPRLVPGWFQRFPNARVLLNRYYFDHLYRRLILRDPYWYRRLHIHRRVNPYLVHRPRYINRIYTQRNIGLPRVLASRSVRVQAARPYLQTLRINRFPVRAAVQTSSIRSSTPVAGGSTTFVRYSSPTIAKYNTPWSRVSSTYRNYGKVESSSIYDRPEYDVGAVGSVYDGGAVGAAGVGSDFSLSSDAGFLGGSLGASGPDIEVSGVGSLSDFDGGINGGLSADIFRSDGGFSSSSVQYDGGIGSSNGDGVAFNGGYANTGGYLDGSELYEGDLSGQYFSSSSEGYDHQGPKAMLHKDVF